VGGLLRAGGIDGKEQHGDVAVCGLCVFLGHIVGKGLRLPDKLRVAAFAVLRAGLRGLLLSLICILLFHNFV
jgi:hypothetical protein